MGSSTEGKVQRRYFEVRHLMPEILSHECSTAEFAMWKRQLRIWINACYFDGYDTQQLWSTFYSRIDSVWQGRVETIPETTDKLTMEMLWDEMKDILLITHPLHTRRIAFLSMKKSKNTKISDFLQKLIEEAKNADISDMPADTLILHC